MHFRCHCFSKHEGQTVSELREWALPITTAARTQLPRKNAFACVCSAALKQRNENIPGGEQVTLDRKHFKVFTQEPSALITFNVEKGQFTAQPSQRLLSTAPIALAGCITLLLVALGRQAIEAARHPRHSTFHVKIYKVQNNRFVRAGGHCAVALHGGAERWSSRKTA